MSKQLTEAQRRERHQDKLAKRDARRVARNDDNGTSGCSDKQTLQASSIGESRLGAMATVEALTKHGGADAASQDSLARSVPGFFQDLDPDRIKIGEVVFVDPKRVMPDEDQPRKQFDDDEQLSLADSVSQDGQEEVAHVYRLKGVKGFDWKVLNGERRLKAALLADARFMVMIKPEPKSRKAKLLAQLRSNQNRVGLHALDEAVAISDAIQEGASIQEVMRNTGIKSELTIKTRLSLLTLDARVQEMMSLTTPKANRLGPGVAAEIAKLPRADQYQTAKESVGLTIQQVRRAVREKLGLDQYDPDTEQGEIPTFPNGRKRVPSDDYKVLRALVGRVQKAFSHYSEISEGQLDRMFKNRSDADRGVLLANLENLVNNAIALRLKIENCRGR